MSIKRPSKSGGSAVRKPATSSPSVRHVDVTAPRQMVSGELYSGWLCKNKACGLVMGVAVAQGAAKPTSESDDQLIVIKCPHCGDENLYHSSARGEHTYVARNAGS
jgi:uncharacterized protein (DUF983 family)